MSKENICPKCNKKISPFYLKENCPHCNVNIVYYRLDERLAEDANQAKKEVDAVDRFINIIKSSTIASPLLIVRLVLFFTPLASMCLNMYGDVSLIKLIMGIVSGSGFDILPLVSMALVIVLSLAVIISSLFSSTKTGFLRNMLLSGVNTIVFVVLGVIIGGMGIGWYITFAIYLAEIVLHVLCDRIFKETII